MKLRDYISINHKIDRSKWKNFVIEELFDISKNIKKYEKKTKNDGTIAFISARSDNNGIAKYCDLKPEASNAITISTNSKSFCCFYHDYDFVPSIDVEVLVNKKLNKYNALFICSILNLESKKYSFEKLAKKSDVQKTIIKLPVNDNGEPDWDYMEEFIKKREKEILELI